MTVRAKFKVSNVKESSYKEANTGEIKKDGEQIEMFPVYSDNPNDENHAFWTATPSGQLTMYINNPAAFGQFEIGAEYYIDFTKAG